METTKQISKIFVPKTLTQKSCNVDNDSVSKDIMKRIIQTLAVNFDNLENPWVQTNYGYYIPSDSVLIPSLSDWSSKETDYRTKKFLQTYCYEVLPLEIGEKIFCRQSSVDYSNYFLKNPFISNQSYVETTNCTYVGVKNDVGSFTYIKVGSTIKTATLPSAYAYKIVPCIKINIEDFLLYVVYGLITVYGFTSITEFVKCFGKNTEYTIDNLKNAAMYLNIAISDITDGSELYKYETQYKTLPDHIVSYFLDTDKVRANLNTYENDILFDSHRGTWDLWSEVSDDNFIEITTDQKVYARNPIADVQRNSVVGIDFGTKSTVVAFQDNNTHTKLMRIGVSNYDDEVKTEDYENPTVLEFCNIESFMKAYRSSDSRPRTSWNDLTVSHTAFEKMNDSNDYYSFLYDVKQWSNSTDNAVIKMTDQNQNDFDIKPYISIEDGDIDPIEIYAYYLGLYINNMRNQIYMKYILSYPVAYPQNVREKIISSFEKGLKKSLPQAVLENAEIMKNFSVKAGTSEPAAYAICALKEFGFNPQVDECVCYGIYDFGGGTTDFDFGQWRCADDDEVEDGYNYVIKHYGDGGVPTLGGENLIELLAYEVLKDNKDKLRADEKYKFTFARPIMGERFEGDENLVNDSKESRRNLKKVTELLRPLWEGGIDFVQCDSDVNNSGDSESQGNELPFKANDDFNFPESVDLIPRNGGTSESIRLEIDEEKLIRLLVAKIQLGVEEFFRAYELAYKSHSNSESYNPEIYNIFLAGKSSQSPILKYCFEKKIESYTEKIISKLKELKKYDYEAENVFFKLYPSLGTAEADEMIGISDENETVMRVTGKTGVAYGLVEGRDSGDIKVESENKPTDESRFKYYIGKAIRGKFTMITDRDVKYNKWYKFLKASRPTVELYFSELPSVAVGETDISESGIVKRIISIDEPHDNAIIVYRAISIDTIEYAVSENEDAANNGDYLYGPITEKLSSELVCV